jgi:undecaprenyl-diphosphatase
LLDIFRKGMWKRLFMLIFASLPAAAAGYFLEDFFEKMYGGAKLLGFGFLLTAIILALSDRVREGRKDLNRMRLWDAVGMGVMQAIAIFPGVSRSGSTISGGLFFGLNRRFAADFSFQMSIPIILGSVILQGKDALEAGIPDGGWTPIAVGTVIAAVCGFIAIKIMLRVVQKAKLSGFAVYVALLGVLVLADQFAFNLFFSRPF